jgi:hypothetical protein
MSAWIAEVFFKPPPVPLQLEHWELALAAAHCKGL